MKQRRYFATRLVVKFAFTDSKYNNVTVTSPGLREYCHFTDCELWSMSNNSGSNKSRFDNVWTLEYVQ